jgi:serine/threonine protein kinase/Tol biopolymer transport system component
MEVSMQDLIGRSTGRYEIKSQIGSGGMAIVYLAHDNTLDCDVAIKFIRTDKLTEENKHNALARFKREAQKTAHLLHPNIVTVTDFGEFEEIPFLVMRYIPGGRTLKGLTGSPTPYAQAVDLILPVAGALQAAHEQGIIHRDVKPSNVLLTNQNIPMLSDFGIAKVLDPAGKSETLTSEGTTVGTPEYMAPEQWHDSAVDARADIYALGVVLYELLTGRPPFKGRNTTGTMIAALTEPIPPARSFAPDLPLELVQVAEKALARNPEERYASMQEFINAMRNAVNTAKASAETGSRATVVQPVISPSDQSTIMEAVTGTVKQNIAPPITPSFTPVIPPPAQVPYGSYYGQPVPVTQKPKSKAGLWIALGVVGLAFIIGAILLIKTLGGGGTPTNKDNNNGGAAPTFTPFVNNPVVFAPPADNPTITPVPLGGVTLEPSKTPTQIPPVIPVNILLVMSSGAIGNSDIFISNEDGSNYHCIACNNSCDEAEPEWSPDHSTIVFQSNCGGTYDIWAVSANGGTPYQLTNTSQFDEREPSWSVNNQVVYRLSPKDENSTGVDDIYFTSIGGTGYPAGFTGRSPEWSPDGGKITYMSNSPGTWQVFVFDMAGGRTNQVSNCSTGCRFPVWSPDGNSIAFNLTDSASSTNPAGIGYLPAGGGVIATLISGYAGRPSWSANGWIAYNTAKGIEAVNVSTRQTKIIVNQTSAWGPCWSQ